MSSSGRIPGDDDYDSDVLADSSSDDGDCSIGNNSKTCNLTDDDNDDEEYGNFLRSFFCENNGTKSPLFPDDDEEDEEEYRPLCVDSNDDDDDDEEDDDGFIKVARKELVDLVDGCWQTIAGEPVQIAAQTTDGLNNQKGRGIKRKSSKLSVTGKSVDDDECPEDELNSGVNIPMSFSRDSDGSSKILSPLLSNDYVPFADIGTHQSTFSNTRSKALGQQTSGQSLISNLVRQIFSGEKPSAVCLDGMPVDAIRKLVARQMSMASQLLVQMLLSAEDRSLCFNTCYTSLMELSNYRERALKKATLLQMNMKNLRVAAFQKISPPNQGAAMNSCRLNQSSNNIDTSPAEMRLTRAVAGRQSKALGSSARSTSLFDLPMLLDITELFETIDLSRREIKAQIASSASQSSVSPCTTDSTASSTRFISPADTLFRSRAAALMALKSQMQRTTSFSTSTRTVSALTKTRVWECLVPSPNSPLGEDLMVGTDPSSLMGRSLFTPAEDDLLLRGIIKHGEDAWKLIRQDFLPSKEEQLLQFRFRQMTSPSAKEASKFKRYTALEKSCRGREGWTHEEDLDLLRGYQIYGDKWPLISIFFFPQKCRRELKSRWQAIQKHWERAFSGNLAPITFQTELPPPSKMLLHFLKESSTNMQLSPTRSPARPVFHKSSYSVPVCQPLFSAPVGLSAAEIGSKAMSHNATNKGQRSAAVYSNSIADDGEAEEDVLADSDEEEREKDLDWHLGLLTRRQSEICQISQALSSNAAMYSGNINRNSRGSNSTELRHQSQGLPVSLSDRGRGAGRAQYLPTASLNPEQLNRSAVSSSMQARQSHRQTQPSAASSYPSLPEVDDSQVRFSSTSNQSSRKDNTTNNMENFSSSSSLCGYTESSYGFEGLSNMTMILAGKANIDSLKDGRNNQRSHLSTSQNHSERSESMKSDVESDEREVRLRMYEDSDPKNRNDDPRRGTSRGLFATVMKQTVI